MTKWKKKKPVNPTSLMRTEEYKSYTIKMLTGSDGYYPQICLDGKWIHEFGCFWTNESKAIEASKEFIDKCNGLPTTDEQLFAMFRK